MWLNNKNSSSDFDNLKITEYEIEVIKDYFKRYREENEELFNNTIDQHLSELKKYREDQAMHMVYRAMIIMKRNGAESLFDFDKLNNNFLKIESSQNIEARSLKISELNKEEEKQKSKEQVQAEIMSHFIQNPDENILMSMVISKDPEDGCEIVEFIDWEYEDKKMNDLFNWPFWIKVWWITIKADETWERWEEFSKELVIDRKTNTKWMLFIWKKWLKLEKFDFEDISKFEASFETYFVYKKEWKTLVKIIKNEIAEVNFRTTGW